MSNQSETADTPIVAYKAFSKDFSCRGFTYEVGKTYEHDGRVEACSSGFHACENPLDVLSYYDLCDSRFAVVEVSGEISRHGDDSKIAAAKLSVKAELGLPQFIGTAIASLMAQANKAFDSVKPDAKSNAVQAASGHSSKLAASGDYSQLAASGKSSVAVAAAPNCVAKAGENGCIALAYWVDAEERYRMAVGHVGEDGIKADTFYGVRDGKLIAEAS